MLLGLLIGLSWGGVWWPVAGVVGLGLLFGLVGAGLARHVGSRSRLVRTAEFDRVRQDLDRIMLREGVFEALPQATLEFQNLWVDAWAVLDIHAVPFFPFPWLTFLSEYQVTSPGRVCH